MSRRGLGEELRWVVAVTHRGCRRLTHEAHRRPASRRTGSREQREVALRRQIVAAAWLAHRSSESSRGRSRLDVRVPGTGEPIWHPRLAVPQRNDGVGHPDSAEAAECRSAPDPATVLLCPPGVQRVATASLINSFRRGAGPIVPRVSGGSDRSGETGDAYSWPSKVVVVSNVLFAVTSSADSTSS